jgi:hypothetical protein
MAGSAATAGKGGAAAEIADEALAILKRKLIEFTPISSSIWTESCRRKPRMDLARWSRNQTGIDFTGGR